MNENVARTIEVMDVNAKITRRPYFYVKRCLDVVAALILMLLLAVPMLIIALSIRLDSRGPVFFLQGRVGFRGAMFRVIKFRTMIDGAEAMEQELMDKTENGFIQAEDDERVTRVGRFLRRLSLDELPQVLNIFLGNMSLIGPRPLIALEVANFTKEQMHRHDVLPGLTGLAQINGRSKLSIEQKVGYDLEYIRNFSFWQDLVLLFKSVPVVLCRRNAV